MSKRQMDRKRIVSYLARQDGKDIFSLYRWTYHNYHTCYEMRTFEELREVEEYDRFHFIAEIVDLLYTYPMYVCDMDLHLEFIFESTFN